MDRRRNPAILFAARNQDASLACRSLFVQVLFYYLLYRCLDGVSTVHLSLNFRSVSAHLLEIVNNLCHDERAGGQEYVEENTE